MLDTNDIKSILSYNIKRLRKERGISQEKLAEMTDLNPQTISSFERKLAWPSSESLNKINKALDIRPYELFLIDTDSVISKENVVNEMKKMMESISLHTAENNESKNFAGKFSHKKNMEE